ncbi:MAG: double zinc ribbon domain-containing protein [Clostridia bacterium]|nr:double zinc ribbon domain-containing protein [Clostridia bacterium]
MKKLLKLHIASIFPNRCAFCGKLVAGDRDVCEDCEKNLPVIEAPFCEKCGRNKNDCDCKKAESYYDGIAAPFYYEGNVKKGLHYFKFRNSPHNSDAYARAMAQTVLKRFDSVDFDYITGVPITRKNRRARGYDQCGLLASKTGKILNIDYRPEVLSKIYETEKQHGMNYYLRHGNLVGVFDIKDPSEVKDKTILLCDDISTSGETLNECSKMLWLYGAKAVYCITLALTKPVKRKDERK